MTKQEESVGEQNERLVAYITRYIYIYTYLVIYENES